MGALLSISLVTAAVAASNAKVTPTTRAERCSDLNRQVDEANKKQAQGIRMLANALRLLGVTPIDPDAQPDLRKKEKKP